MRRTGPAVSGTGGRVRAPVSSMLSVLAVVSVASPSPVPAQDPWPVLDRASAAYATLTTLSATFVQVIDNPLIGGPDTSRGRLYLERPARFAMRFTEPAGDRIVADGRYLWLYAPSTTPGQVIRTRIPAEGGVTPNLIGQFVERPRERYRARWLRADSLGSGVADVVHLTPLDPAAPYREATVWVDRGDALVRRIEIVEASGQLRAVRLTTVERNAAVPARELSFSPPAGARVVDQ